MNCPECREWIDDLLLRDPDDAPPAEVAAHLMTCVDCASEHAMALETLEAVTPRTVVVASPRLKARLVAAGLAPSHAVAPSTKPSQPPHSRAVRAGLGVALAAGVLLAVVIFPTTDIAPQPNGGGGFSLLAQASAAEARLFAADDIVGLTSEIVVEPLDNAALIEARWLPLVSIGADGKERDFQLKLGGKPGEGYTVRDESWFDPTTRRFAHVLSLRGRPLFANSYDGRFVHLLELDEQGVPRIKDERVTAEFQPPREPSDFLGVFAFIKVSQTDAGRRHKLRDEGPTRLADGTPGHRLRMMIEQYEDNPQLQGYFLATIRDDNHRIESLSFHTQGRLLFTIRRSEAAGDREPGSGWDLARLRSTVRPEKGGTRSPVQTLADFIRPSVTVEEMAKRADYPTYVFARDPGWSARRQIMDMVDLPSPTHRMFAVVYPAKDRRHLVLVQAHTFNANLGALAHTGKLMYTSASGVKVWSEKNQRKMAEILLSSIGGTGLFPGPPAEDRTCYLLETPEGAFPALAVNGTLTEAELHGLVDSLERARPR